MYPRYWLTLDCWGGKINYHLALQHDASTEYSVWNWDHPPTQTEVEAVIANHRNLQNQCDALNDLIN